MREEFKQIKSGRKELREFALVVGGALVLLSWYGWFRKGWDFLPGAAAGSVLILTGCVRPALLKPLQKIWMGAALCMGWLMSRVLLSVFFFIFLTPLALFLRFRGKKFLDLEFDRGGESYWIQRAPLDKAACERQY